MGTGYDISIIVGLIGLCFFTLKKPGILGARTPWNLTNVDNWVATNRFAGKLWVLISVIGLVSSFLGLPSYSLVLSLIILSIPVVFAYSARFKP